MALVLIAINRLLRPLRGDSGQSLVEFGLILPFLCGLIGCFAEVGFGVNDSIDATHVANQGVRIAVVNELTRPALITWIKSQATTKDVIAGTVNPCLPPRQDGAANTGQIGSPVEVIVKANFKIVPIIGGVTFPIRAHSTMRIERSLQNAGYPAC